MARPVDPRLWRYASAARRYLIVSVGLSSAVTASIVVAALMLARVAAGVITDPGRRTAAAWATELVVLAVALAVRVVASWWQSRVAHRAGAQVVAELENSVLTAGAALPPRELDSRRTELAVVVGDGLGGLRAYLTGYLPALLLAALIPPIVLVVIALHDLTAAVIILVTLPLIPLFMILIGLMTKGRAEQALGATTRLSDQMLDLFAGMPTLRALGRETGAADAHAPTMRNRVRELGEALHKRTMATLRVAFLSSMVLEMLATLCVALVAVAIGMRLVYGNMELYAGLLGLILAPEVYLPLRTVGERFHAAQDGMAAAERAFAVLDPPVGADRCDDAAGDRSSTVAGCRDRGAPEYRGGPVTAGSAPPSGPIELCEIGVRARDGYAPAGLSTVLQPGAVTVLTGPNGSGKSTALQAILGLTRPEQGCVRVAGRPLDELNPEAWWARLAWLPQRPVLLPGTLRENLELFGADPASPDIDRICAATGFDGVLAELPARWDTVVGAGGLGLSLGQRQRLALTRVLAADRSILLLDEPTAHLDDRSEATVLTALSARARAGATVIVVAHRPTVLAIADRIVEVEARGLPTGEEPESPYPGLPAESGRAPTADTERVADAGPALGGKPGAARRSEPQQDIEHWEAMARPQWSERRDRRLPRSDTDPAALRAAGTTAPTPDGEATARSEAAGGTRGEPLGPGSFAGFSVSGKPEAVGPGDISGPGAGGGRR